MKPIDLTKNSPMMKRFNPNKLPYCGICGTEEIGARKFDPLLQDWICGPCVIKMYNKRFRIKQIWVYRFRSLKERILKYLNK